MYPLMLLGTSAPSLDVSGITDSVTTQGVIDLIETVFPIVAVAILTGIVFYVVKWAIRLFRGI